MSLAAELRDFLHRRRWRSRPTAAPFERRPTPHVHACPECYEVAPCGLRCTIVPDLQRDNGMPAGSPCVCPGCLRRAGLDPDAFMTSLPDAEDA